MTFRGSPTSLWLAGRHPGLYRAITFGEFRFAPVHTLIPPGLCSYFLLIL